MDDTSIYSSWWLPIDISTHGAPIDQLINVLHYFSIALFVGWGAFMVYCLVRFRARPGHRASISASHFKLPTYLEIGIAIFEVWLLVGISYPVWRKYKNEPPNEKDALVVKVIAEQFAWNIHYPGRDGQFGRTSLDLMDATNPIGLDRSDPAAKDDIATINNLHIPIHKPVIAHLSSKDVIHSFTLPVMRIKQDAVPGLNIPVWFEATRTGEYQIGCAQLCGIGHARMVGQFFVDTPEAYNTWMAEEEKALREEG